MRRTALALSLLVLVFPASALAQSAGDNQYQDPFANQGTSQGTSQGSGSQSNSTSSGTTSSGTTSSSTASNPSSSSGTAGTSSSGTTASGSSGSGQLPFTGYDSVFSGVLGAVLLLGGLTVRASVRDRGR